jgi:PAS domain S-box-containing protein
LKTRILSKVQRLAPLQLLSMSVVLAVLITEAVVSVMGLLLKGEIPTDYLLTGLVASLFAAASVVALLNILFEALRKSADEIADLYHHTPCGYHSLDKDGIFQQINDTELAWLGYMRDEVIGKVNWTNLLTPAGIQIFRETFPQLMKQGFIHDIEVEIIRKDGTTFAGLVNATAIYDTGGNFVMSRSTVTDITGRKQAEEALHRYKNLLRQIIDADPNMISVKNAEGKFLVVNQAMAAMHGMTPKELVGRNGAEQFQTEENYAPIWQADREVIETLRKVEVMTQDYRNGMERWFHITKVPMQQVDGTVHVLGIGVDITEKRLAEQQQREHVAHLQAVREEEKTHIAREIHDELGGTLTALKMEFHWLAQEAAGCNAAARMLDHIESMSQLLDSAAGISRRIMSELHPTILDAFGFQAALEWQAAQFHKRTGIECLVNCTQDDHHGDDGRCTQEQSCETELNKVQAINLFRIFQESLTNVAKHSGASRVETELYFGCGVALSVRDNGRGLPAGHTIASTSYGMRGMAERVKQLGGEIRFDSPSGGGFEVTVKLPGGSEEWGEA